MDWFYFVFFGVLVGFNLAVLPAAWRRSEPHGPDPSGPAAAWTVVMRGVNRLDLVGLFLLLPMAVYMGCVAFTSADRVQAALEGWEPAIFIWSIGGFSLVASVVLFNAPKKLVPPSQRSELGLIPWLTRERRDSRASASLGDRHTGE